jgi:hypothetical protein
MHQLIELTAFQMNNSYLNNTQFLIPNSIPKPLTKYCKEYVLEVVP